MLDFRSKINQGISCALANGRGPGLVPEDLDAAPAALMRYSDPTIRNKRWIVDEPFMVYGVTVLA